MKFILSLFLVMPAVGIASQEFRALNLGDRALAESQDLFKNYEFECVDTRTFKTPDTDWKTEAKPYTGRGGELTVTENHEVFVEEASDKSWKDVTTLKTTKVDEVTLLQVMETVTTNVYSDKTVVENQLIERTIKIENGVKKIVSNKVNGVEVGYPWEKYNVDLADGSKIYTRVHTNPSVMNKDGKEYSRRFETCVYTYR